jgi:hypothetical protein
MKKFLFFYRIGSLCHVPCRLAALSVVAKRHLIDQIENAIGRLEEKLNQKTKRNNLKK